MATPCQPSTWRTGSSPTSKAACLGCDAQSFCVDLQQLCPPWALTRAARPRRWRNQRGVPLRQAAVVHAVALGDRDAARAPLLRHRHGISHTALLAVGPRSAQQRPAWHAPAPGCCCPGCGTVELRCSVGAHAAAQIGVRRQECGLLLQSGCSCGRTLAQPSSSAWGRHALQRSQEQAAPAVPCTLAGCAWARVLAGSHPAASPVLCLRLVRHIRLAQATLPDKHSLHGPCCWHCRSYMPNTARLLWGAQGVRALDSRTPKTIDLRQGAPRRRPARCPSPRGGSGCARPPGSPAPPSACAACRERASQSGAWPCDGATPCTQAQPSRLRCAAQHGDPGAAACARQQSMAFAACTGLQCNQVPLWGCPCMCDSMACRPCGCALPPVLKGHAGRAAELCLGGCVPAGAQVAAVAQRGGQQALLQAAGLPPLRGRGCGREGHGCAARCRPPRPSCCRLLLCCCCRLWMLMGRAGGAVSSALALLVCWSPRPACCARGLLQAVAHAGQIIVNPARAIQAQAGPVEACRAALACFAARSPAPTAAAAACLALRKVFPGPDGTFPDRTAQRPAQPSPRLANQPAQNPPVADPGRPESARRMQRPVVADEDYECARALGCGTLLWTVPADVPGVPQLHLQDGAHRRLR